MEIYSIPSKYSGDKDELQSRFCYTASQNSAQAIFIGKSISLVTFQNLLKSYLFSI